LWFVQVVSSSPAIYLNGTINGIHFFLSFSLLLLKYVITKYRYLNCNWF
jgi:hypothetical protein